MSNKVTQPLRINPVAKFLKSGKLTGAGAHGPSRKACRQKDRIQLRKEWS